MPELTVAEIAALSPHHIELYRKLAGDAFPPPEAFEACNEQVRYAVLDKAAERWVYFVRAETGQVKIGVATCTTRRLRGLQTCSPVRLHLEAQTRGGATLESQYHARFAAHRLHGEWFSPHPDILAEIDRLNTTRPATLRGGCS